MREQNAISAEKSSYGKIINSQFAENVLVIMNKHKEMLLEDLRELLKKTREQETYFSTKEVAELLKEVYKKDIENIKKDL